MANDVTLDESNQGKVLQLAMAFGQGAGSLVADEFTALEAGIRIQTMLAAAFVNWADAEPTATALVRIAGQMAAQRAVQNGHHAIQSGDIDWDRIAAFCRCA